VLWLLDGFVFTAQGSHGWKVRIMTLTYEWQRFYKAAVSETQPGKMQEALTKAEHAIQQRLADCPPTFESDRPCMAAEPYELNALFGLGGSILWRP
jgi:hypothetical protein